MRKSFTRFLSLFVLFSIFSLFAVAIPAFSPTVVSPASPATNVDPRSGSVTVTLTFAENVYPGTSGAGVIALSNSADVQLDPVQVSSMNNTNPVTGSSVVINGNVVTITFKYSPIPEETTFYVTATSDALKNAAGGYWAGWQSFGGVYPAGTHGYVFTTGDFTAPKVLSTTPFDPVDNSSANAISKIYTVTFDENIQPGTGFIQTGDVVAKPGNIGLYKENGNVVELFNVTTATATTTPAEGAVGIVGSTLYINPTDANLVELGKYYIRILNTAITDLNVAPIVDNKNIFAGINDNTTWNFQLEDKTPPTFVVSPANAATNVQQGAAMKMTFSDNRTAAGLLFELKSVTSTPPTVVANLAVGANVTSLVSFDVDPTGGAAFAPLAAGTWKATYTATNEITVEFISPAKFTTGANYRLNVVALSLADVEKNIVVSAPSTFKAGDFTVPYVVNAYAQPAGVTGTQIAPFNLNTAVADLETTKIYFGLETGDADITSGLATLPTSVKYLTYLATATAPTAATVLASGSDLPIIASNTFKHEAFISTDATGAALLSNTAYKIYYVVTDNATVKNSSALLTANVTTNDIEAPTYTVKYWLGAAEQTATAVDKAGKVVITFNEDVASNTAGTLFSATPSDFASTFTLIQTNVTPNVTLVNGTDFTVNKVSDKVFEIIATHSNWTGSASWMSKGNYSLALNSNKIYDLASTLPKTGTPNAAVASSNGFTVKDYEGPTVVFNPLNAATNVNNNGDITITFSETPYYLGVPVTQANIDALIELRKGDATTATTGSPLEPRTVTLSGNVVTITPSTKPLSSEIKYRASVSTDVTDVNGYKLNKFSDNSTPIPPVLTTIEYSVFKTSDNRTPLVTYTTYVGTTAIPAAQDNVARVAQGLVNVDNVAYPVILLDESVQEVVGNTPIANLDPNQIRSLITLKKGDANGKDIEFNVLLASTNTGLTPPPTGMFEIVLDPINYPAPYVFDNSGTYYFSISGIQDAAKNPINGSAIFTVINSTALTLSGSTPANAATGVAKSGNIVLTFNQNISKTTTSGSFFITSAPAGLNIDVTNAAVTVSGNQVTIPYSGFAQDLPYTINVPAGAFAAVANNALNGVISTTFRTVDEFGPTIDFGTAAVPDESTPNVVALSNGQLSLTFTENIVLGNGYIKIRKPEVAGATTVADINVQSSYVTIDPLNSAKVKITIPVTLLYNQAYFVEIPQTAFKDAAGNNFQWSDSDHAIALHTADVTAPVFPYALGNATWDFSTVTDAIPTYTGTFVPAVNADDVAVNAGLTINFSEPVSLATSGIRELTIFRAVDNTTLQTIDLSTATLVWNATLTQVTVQHLPFEANKAYYINISPNAFKDLSVPANSIAALTSTAATGWYFTTQDKTAPTATLATASGAALTAVPLADNLVLTFSEPIALVGANTWATALTLSTGTFTATLDASKKVLTINPDNNFSSLTSATLDINAGRIQDLATIPMPIAAATFVLKGEDKTAPVWSAGYPVGVSPAYAKDKVKFDVALDEKSTVYYMTTLAGAYSTNPSAAIVKANSSYSYTASPFVANAVKTIEITGLNEYTTYEVYVFAEDLFGNQTVVSKLTLYTTDVTAPTLVSLYPANGAIDVNYNHGTPAFNGIDLKIRLNEKISFTAINAKLVVRKYDNNVKVFEADKTTGLSITNSSGTLQDVVTVNVPKAVLLDKTQYYVEFEYNMVTDVKNGLLPAPFAAANNVFADAFIGKADWSFTTADETVPVLASVAPATTTVPAFGAVDVPVTAPGTLTMRFSEPISIGTGTIYIYRVGVATPQEVITIPSSDVVINPANNKELLITRHNTFASEISYYVQFPATGVKDLAPVPNYYAGIAPLTWTFTTADITSPAVVWTPANNATSVALATTVTAVFSDPRQVELGGAIVNDQLYNSGTLLASGDIKGWFTVTANGSSVALTSANYVNTFPVPTVSFNVTGGLKSNTTYVFTLNAPATLTDDKSNPVPSSSVTFSTVDNNSPFITFTPAVTTTNVPINSYVTVKFNKTIYNNNMLSPGTSPNANFTPTAADFATGNYVTFKQGLTPVAFNTEVVTPGLEYRLIPTAPLASTTIYDVVWVANRGTVQEVYDRLALPTENKLDQTLVQRTTTFTTEDVVAPTVTVLNPLNTPPTLKIVNPTSAITMTFSENVVAGTGNIQIRRGNGQIFHEVAASACTYAANVVTIPHPAFEKFTSYYVIIPNGAITDASANKNKFAGFGDNTFWSFKTDDGTAPFVTLYTPENGSNNIPVFSNLILQFSENIQPNVGNIVIYYKNYVDPVTGDGNAIEIIPIGSPKVVISGSNIVQGLTSDVVTIDPSTTFDKLGTFYVRIDNGIVKDFANTPNSYAGINNNTTWAFTVTDNTKPALSSTSPLNGAINVSSKPTLTMNFDKNVLAGTGNIKLLEYFYNPATFAYEEKLVESISVTSPQVVVNGMVVTVTPSVALGDGKLYYVLVDNTAITNTASSKDPWTGISSPFIWRFTIGDNTAPTLVVTAPVAPVAKTFNVGLKFNEVVTGVDAAAFTGLIKNGTLNSVTGTGSDYTLNVTGAEKAIVGIQIPKTIADASGNKFAGDSLKVTVGDFTGPTVKADPSTGVNLKSTFPVVLTFSDDAVVKASDITVTGATKNVITNVGNVYTVTITANDLATVNVAVAPTVADNSGNVITGTTNFTYKVGDNTAPTLVISGPTAPIATTFIVSLKFNESVTGVDKNSVTVTNGAIKQLLGSGTDYLLSITAEEKAAVVVAVSNAVVDANGNSFAGKSMTFTVGDFTAPKVVVTPPVSPVATVFSVGLKFDENVSGLLFGGSAVTVTGGKLLDITGKNDTYTLVVSAVELADVKIVLTDAIVDAAANKFAGLTLNYTIGDFTAPELVTMTPTIDDLLADNHPTFKMNFSENVKLAAGGNLKVYKVNTTTPVLTIPITADMISGKIVTVSYSTTNGLDKNARYYVLVDGTSLTDNAGNAFDGVSDVAAWTFKTGAKIVTDIEPNSSLEFKVYPNPFVDVVNLVSPSQLSKAVVTNIAGQIVKEVINPTNSIQLNELRSGIYFISLYDMDNVIAKTAKIVKR